MAKARMILVEDDALLSSLLVDWIQQRPHWELAGQARTGEAGLDLCRTARPDILLLDIALPGMDGIAVARTLMEEQPALKILILTCHAEPYPIQRIQALGVQGYINKASSLVTLEQAINCLLEGGTYRDETFRQATRNLATPEAFHKILTQREIDVLRLVAEGLSDAGIGQALGITPNTVAAHRRNIRVKLGAHCDRDMIFYARQWGLAPGVGQTKDSMG